MGSNQVVNYQNKKKPVSCRRCWQWRAFIGKQTVHWSSTLHREHAPLWANAKLEHPMHCGEPESVTSNKGDEMESDAKNCINVRSKHHRRRPFQSLRRVCPGKNPLSRSSSSPSKRANLCDLSSHLRLSAPRIKVKTDCVCVTKESHGSILDPKSREHSVEACSACSACSVCREFGWVRSSEMEKRTHGGFSIQ